MDALPGWWVQISRIQGTRAVQPLLERKAPLLLSLSMFLTAQISTILAVLSHYILNTLGQFLGIILASALLSVSSPIGALADESPASVAVPAWNDDTFRLHCFLHGHKDFIDILCNPLARWTELPNPSVSILSSLGSAQAELPWIIISQVEGQGDMLSHGDMDILVELLIQRHDLW